MLDKNANVGDNINRTIEIYQNYMQQIGDRLSLYKAVADAMQIKSAIYPGSHVDITPSLVIPRVTYVDNFKGTMKFFADIDAVKCYIEQNKNYPEPCEIAFIPQDYTDPMNIDEADLIISQFAGFVGQATKKYLNPGGILLCNDSHGDATLAKKDSDFEFVGVVLQRQNQYYVDSENTSQYFVLPKGKQIDLSMVHTKMKGPNYRLQANNYLFRKIK